MASVEMSVPHPPHNGHARRLFPIGLRLEFPPDHLEGAMRREGADDDIQQGLGVRTRTEHVGGDVQHDLPEALLAQDARHGLALQPTLETGDIPGLDPEVREHDPHLALDGGPDGLQPYRDLRRRLKHQAGVDGGAVDAGGLQAIAVARENAANLDLNGRCTFIRTDWAAGFADDSFDLVVSNPPYIPTGDIPGLDPEVREHDPHLALDGGPDGLESHDRFGLVALALLPPPGFRLRPR